MAAHAGDVARQTHVFECARCGKTVPVKQGDTIPACPDGHTEFKRRMQEPRTRRRPA